MKRIRYEDRACECCRGSTLEEVWAYATKARTKSDTYLWKVRNVVCKTRGFAFVAPRPTVDSLAEYYADSYEYWRAQPLDYSIENRISLLKRHIRRGTRPSFVEVGSNANERFRSELSRVVGDYAAVELNRSCASDFRSLADLPKAGSDVAAAYFVLEHVPRPREFLASCAACLRKDGVLILEVPNLYIYPINPAGLLWWEHVNHFSPRSLALLAASEGLRLLDLSCRWCSRPFGFAAVFSKAADKRHGAACPADRSEYHLARACMGEGLSLIRAYHGRLAEVRKRIRDVAKQKAPIVIWAANRICSDLLEGLRLPETAVVVDSNPDKKRYLDPVPVHQPSEVREAILHAKLVVINTRSSAAEIVDFIRQQVGRELGAEELIVLDTGC